MRLLLDTCTFLWIIKGSDELSNNARKLYSAPENEVFLSTISVWEMVVKYQLNRLPLPRPPVTFIANERKRHHIESLTLHEEAIEQLLQLPDHHKDPFDRMLICQAIAHNLTLVTPDDAIKRYPVATVW